jgi:hypothetical protein
MDTTPNTITSGHITITDETTTCDDTVGTQPDNIAILVCSVDVGMFVESDIVLSVTDFDFVNTGIGGSGQCVFHLSFEADEAGFPAIIIDIVVVNIDGSPLDGLNTITVSAQGNEE